MSIVRNENRLEVFQTRLCPSQLVGRISIEPRTKTATGSAKFKWARPCTPELNDGPSSTKRASETVCSGDNRVAVFLKKLRLQSRAVFVIEGCDEVLTWCRGLGSAALSTRFSREPLTKSGLVTHLWRVKAGTDGRLERLQDF